MNVSENVNAPNRGEAFQILSLDGGGIKGVFSVALLAALEQDLGIRVADHFDLIAGTSTGGIIALGLGLGLSPRDILDFYVEWGQRIFPKRRGSNLFHWFSSKYPCEPLEMALRHCFGEKLFSDSKKRLVIPSFNLGEDDVYIFRTRHHERLRRDYKVPAWKIALATSAAPTFLPSYRGIDSIRLVDGGVWANNPSVVAIVEAYSTLNVPLTSMRVLNIGTTDPIVKRHERLDSGGKIAWARNNAAVDVILHGQSLAAFKQAIHLIGRDNIVRLSPAVVDGAFSLDGVTQTDDLIAKAAHHSRVFSPEFGTKFGTHKAEPFTSLPI
jgi:patatin-like phospholipase/acyl hydrolase